MRHSAQKYGKQIIKHRKSCHKICFIPSTQIILSCGEDGAVYRYDPRERDHSDPKPIVQYRQGSFIVRAAKRFLTLQGNF